MVLQQQQQQAMQLAATAPLADMAPPPSSKKPKMSLLLPYGLFHEDLVPRGSIPDGAVCTVMLPEEVAVKYPFVNLLIMNKPVSLCRMLPVAAEEAQAGRCLSDWEGVLMACDFNFVETMLNGFIANLPPTDALWVGKCIADMFRRCMSGGKVDKLVLRRVDALVGERVCVCAVSMVQFFCASYQDGAALPEACVLLGQVSSHFFVDAGYSTDQIEDWFKDRRSAISWRIHTRCCYFKYRPPKSMCGAGPVYFRQRESNNAQEWMGFRGDRFGRPPLSDLDDKWEFKLFCAAHGFPVLPAVAFTNPIGDEPIKFRTALPEDLSIKEFIEGPKRFKSINGFDGEGQASVTLNVTEEADPNKALQLAIADMYGRLDEDVKEVAQDYARLSESKYKFLLEDIAGQVAEQRPIEFKALVIDGSVEVVSGCTYPQSNKRYGSTYCGREGHLKAWTKNTSLSAEKGRGCANFIDAHDAAWRGIEEEVCRICRSMWVHLRGGEPGSPRIFRVDVFAIQDPEAACGGEYSVVCSEANEWFGGMVEGMWSEAIDYPYKPEYERKEENTPYGKHINDRNNHLIVTINRVLSDRFS